MYQLGATHTACFVSVAVAKATLPSKDVFIGNKRLGNYWLNDMILDSSWRLHNEMFILFMKVEYESNFILFKGFVKLRPDKLVNEIIVRDLLWWVPL